MFGAMHFIYYISRLIATKGDSTYLGYLSTAYRYLKSNFNAIEYY